MTLGQERDAAERALRSIAVGHKNWNFFGSDSGGITAALLFSFSEPCRRHRFNPWKYLCAMLTAIPSTPLEQLAALLPDAWAHQPIAI